MIRMVALIFAQLAYDFTREYCFRKWMTWLSFKGRGCNCVFRLFSVLSIRLYIIRKGSKKHANDNGMMDKLNNKAKKYQFINKCTSFVR